MSCRAPNLLDYEQSIKLPLLKNLNNTNDNDVKLNLQLLNKYFEVQTLDETLVNCRNEFQTRTEHLQKRKDALHEKEIMFKQRILSYEIYIKELAMKHDRSLRRIDDEKNIIKNKQIEIELLKKDIEHMQQEKIKLQKILSQYQPHLNLLIQIVDQTDRFHSIDEMIEKFDMLYASYQDILVTIKNSNEELNDVQKQLLLTIENKNNKISFMNNRIHELQQNYTEIQQRIEKIRIEISNYQQISTEHLTEVGAISIAIESMFDLVKRYSHRSRKKDLNLDECSLNKLKHIDMFLSDLIYYVDYMNNKQNKILQQEYSNNTKLEQRNVSHQITDSIDDNNRWRGPCQIDRRETLIKTIDKHEQQTYFSYKIRGEDDMLYTIQINNIHKSDTCQAHKSSSSISMISNNKEKKSSSFKIQKSLDTQPRSSTSRSTHTTLKLFHQQSNHEKMPFSTSELINDK
ncbi:unnamed protein product [Adineta steineri]|uniref:DUF4200 domain-containing protein n=1 Tax=Adineta steineri TaxID=433720 RepID=A0A813MJP2_9BILA|nr:unnamed protein product [Adineta steineri]CAF3593023.1 unnamed protein product [Adineta steineri]